MNIKIEEWVIRVCSILGGACITAGLVFGLFASSDPNGQPTGSVFAIAAIAGFTGAIVGWRVARTLLHREGTTA